MFTGIVEEVGNITDITWGAASCRLSVHGAVVYSGLKLGDSVAVNGVCLTVDQLLPEGFAADVMPGTMNSTSLGSLRRGSLVNLERAMRADGRFGGHLVSGHIDGTGKVIRVRCDDNAVLLKVCTTAEIMELLVSKGSIAIDGVSLTVARLEPDGFWVSLIPHTAVQTILLQRNNGDLVNLECDMIGKYVHKFMAQAGNERTSEITMDFLKEHGF